jgi:hypothetical protein
VITAESTTIFQFLICPSSVSTPIFVSIILHTDSFQTSFPPTYFNEIQTSIIQPQQDHGRLTLQTLKYSVILMGLAFILSWTLISTPMTDSDHTAGLLPGHYVHRRNSILMWQWLLRRESSGRAEALITETLISRTSDN